jgi:hypothetical protein
MDDKIEQSIMERIKEPGWVTTRGILLDPTGQLDTEEHRRIEAAMKRLQGRGLVALWKLTVQNDGAVLLAAARPDYQLDTELEERGAWAKAERY